MNLQLRVQDTLAQNERSASTWVAQFQGSWSRRALILILLFALLLRTAWAIVSDRLDPLLQGDPLHSDAASYESLTRSLLAGTGYRIPPNGPDVFWPPGYPFFLAAIQAVFGENILAVRVIQALLGTLTVVIIFLVAREVIGQRLALGVAAAAACHPFLVYWGNWLIADGLFMLLWSSILLLALWTRRRPSPGMSASLGALIGLSMLTKPYILFSVPLLLLWLASTGKQPLKSRLRHALLILLVAGIVIVPWSVRNLRVAGGLVPISINGGYTFLAANNPDAFGGAAEGFPPLIRDRSPAQAQQEYYRRGLEWILSSPAAWARLLPVKLQRLWSPLTIASQPEPFRVPGAVLLYAAWASFLGLAVIGALSSFPWDKDRSLLWIPILATSLSALVFYGDTRYSLPMVPSLVIFVVLGVGCLFQTLSRVLGMWPSRLLTLE